MMHQAGQPDVLTDKSMISVIVCSRNRAESLRKTLSSLSALRAASGILWELIIVDNNSRDHTREVVETFAADTRLPIRYIREANQGLSIARNSGINQAQGDIIAFTDDDVTVDQNWVCGLYRTFTQFGCMGVGGRIVPVWTAKRPDWLELDGPQALRTGAVVYFDRGPQPTQLHISPYGANMAFRRAAFERYGGFRSDLGAGSDGALGEDTEFGMRLLRAGEMLAYAPDAVVYHPVTQARMTKRHFQRHYFNYGRYTARINGFPESAIRWFGVPRYLYRSLMQEVWYWLSAFDSRQRLRRKFQVWESLGVITEARRLSNQR